MVSRQLDWMDTLVHVHASHNEGTRMIELPAETNLNSVDCSECKRDARPNFVPHVHRYRQEPLKNITDGHHEGMDYPSNRLAI